MAHLADLWGYMIQSFREIQPADILDILVVSVFAYIIINFLRETRAGQFIKGIIVFFVIWLLSDFLNLYTTHTIINTMFDFGVFAILIVFQPEIRSMLEKVGQKGFKGFHLINSDQAKQQMDSRTLEMISSITDACKDLSATKTGALIVIERDTKLGDVINSGTVVEAMPSSNLIRNLFYPKAPLHDGAVIFRDGMVYAAGCFLPLSTQQMDSDLGTRHHAAMGMSEVSDAVVVVVSEETGIISVAVNGNLTRRLSPDDLSVLLKKYLLTSEEKKEFLGGIIRSKKTDKEEKE